MPFATRAAFSNFMLNRLRIEISQLLALGKRVVMLTPLPFYNFISIPIRRDLTVMRAMPNAEQSLGLFDDESTDNCENSPPLLSAHQ
jgi:hypothetical protein